MEWRTSRRQRDVIRHAGTRRTLVFAVGATRSGKSWAAALSHALWLVNHGGGHDHVVAGRTATTAYRNVVRPLLEHLRMGGVPCKWRPGDRMLDVSTVAAPARVHVLGANDRQAREKIQGATLKSLHIDEFPLLDKDFWPMALSRLSVDGAKIWATANPEGPLHWAKREVVDRIEELDGVLVQFEMNDNPALSDAVKARIKSGLTGVWRRRLIEGVWAGVSGQVFPRWETCAIDEVPASIRWYVGFDWGAASVTAGLLFAGAPCEDARWPERAVAVSEFRWDARAEHTLDDDAMLAKIVAWLGGEVPFAKPSEFEFVVDPATHAGFKLLLKRAGYRLRDAENDVLAGLAATDARLTAGNVKLLEGQCPHLERELAEYAWDARAQDRGEDRPVKSGDHAVDALRYFAATTARRSGYELWRERASKGWT